MMKRRNDSVVWNFADILGERPCPRAVLHMRRFGVNRYINGIAEPFPFVEFCAP